MWSNCPWSLPTPIRSSATKKVATCTEPGYTGDTYCKDCGLLIRQGELLPALGHDYEAEVTAPTCTKQGYTTHTCSRCGDSYVDGYTEALGHDWDGGSVTTPATCEEDGVRTFTCNYCSETRTETIPPRVTPGTRAW